MGKYISRNKFLLESIFSQIYDHLYTPIYFPDFSVYSSDFSTVFAQQTTSPDGDGKNQLLSLGRNILS